MSSSPYFYNILPFRPQFNELDLYFTDNPTTYAERIHEKLVPDDILFPFKKENDELEHLYTTYTSKHGELQKFSLPWSSLTLAFKKRFLNWYISRYFQALDIPVRFGFIKDTQVMVPNTRANTEQFHAYSKFSLKVQYKIVSGGFELLLAYNGQSKVFTKNAVALTQNAGSEHFNWVIHGNQMIRWEHLNSDNQEKVNYEKVYPVLNKQLSEALHLPAEIPRPENRYKKYLHYINGFYKKFLLDDDSLQDLGISQKGFLNVSDNRVTKTSFNSNVLAFGNEHKNRVPKYALRDQPPYEPSRLSNITLFFIMHESDVRHAKAIKKQFDEGFSWFQGLYDYVGLVLHVQPGLSITFTDQDNPLPEIRRQLDKREFKPDVSYVAIYLTPIDKYVPDDNKREVYYHVKELLLQRQITSQAINPNKMAEQGKNWVYSLPNIAIALLAKLDGVPWRLDTPVTDELVIGIGAFHSQKDDVRYIGSSFSFRNDGRFNRFEYFQKNDIDLLAGSIADAVRKFAQEKQSPQRLVIHFYKTMSQKELNPILQELQQLGLNIPVFIVSINKTESRDIVAFDKNWKEKMPKSGTVIKIGKQRYLLFNNTRYGNYEPNIYDGYPFPVKLQLRCTVPEQLEDEATVQELIDQVYQFSRMYWKSLRQQNLPVTIKYPEMVAQMAPHFEGGDIPPFGKQNLWFL